MTHTLWRHVHKTEGCWLWTAAVNNSGYGSVYFNGKRTGAHRASYEMAYGPFDKNLCVLHRCDNPRCVRPDHLWLGTRTDNMQDCACKGRMLKAYRWTTENHPYKGKTIPDHTKEAVRKAKQRPFSVIDPAGKLIEGINLTAFCKERGLSQGAMWHVLNGTQLQHKGYRKP